ncbi:MAG: DsrE family protein [Actinomycetota bacterium]|nr:DsrE family protein [Actinomycetota bacterium]
MAADDKVVIGLTHDGDDAESVLIAHLLGVEALRAGKEALMWLTKNGVLVAAEGFAATVNVPNAPSIADLHTEYIERGGRFYACPVCVKTRGLENASWVKGAEVKGAPALYEFTAGGALTFND